MDYSLIYRVIDGYVVISHYLLSTFIGCEATIARCSHSLIRKIHDITGAEPSPSNNDPEAQWKQIFDSKTIDAKTVLGYEKPTGIKLWYDAKCPLAIDENNTLRMAMLQLIETRGDASH